MPVLCSACSCLFLQHLATGEMDGETCVSQGSYKSLAVGMGILGAVELWQTGMAEREE